MTIIQEAKQYLKRPDACVMESRIIEELLTEIRCLKVQVCDRGNSFQKVNEENKYLRQLLADALPHIECNNPEQDALITAIGGKLTEESNHH